MYILKIYSLNYPDSTRPPLGTGPGSTVTCPLQSSGHPEDTWHVWHYRDTWDMVTCCVTLRLLVQVPPKHDHWLQDLTEEGVEGSWKKVFEGSYYMNGKENTENDVLYWFHLTPSISRHKATEIRNKGEINMICFIAFRRVESEPWDKVSITASLNV